MGDCTIERKMKKYGHVANVFEELARRVILLFSFQKDIILRSI